MGIKALKMINWTKRIYFWSWESTCTDRSETRGHRSALCTISAVTVHLCKDLDLVRHVPVVTAVTLAEAVAVKVILPKHPATFQRQWRRAEVEEEVPGAASCHFWRKARSRALWFVSKNQDIDSMYPDARTLCKPSCFESEWKTGMNIRLHGR